MWRGLTALLAARGADENLERRQAGGVALVVIRLVHVPESELARLLHVRQHEHGPRLAGVQPRVGDDFHDVLEVGNAQSVLDGALDSFMEAYLRQPK